MDGKIFEWKTTDLYFAILQNKYDTEVEAINDSMSFRGIQRIMWK